MKYLIFLVFFACIGIVFFVFVGDRIRLITNGSENIFKGGS
jgi:hypothetical protein